MIVDNAIYVDGRRAAEPLLLPRDPRGGPPSGWVGLDRAALAHRGGVLLGGRGVRATPAGRGGRRQGPQWPKLERYDGTLFVVLRPARYVDETETVEFGEVHVFVGEDFVVHGPPGEASELGEGANPAGGRPRATAAGTGGGPLRRHGQGGR